MTRYYKVLRLDSDSFGSSFAIGNLYKHYNISSINRGSDLFIFNSKTNAIDYIDTLKSIIYSPILLFHVKPKKPVLYQNYFSDKFQKFKHLPIGTAHTDELTFIKEIPIPDVYYKVVLINDSNIGGYCSIDYNSKSKLYYNLQETTKTNNNSKLFCFNKLTTAIQFSNSHHFLFPKIFLCAISGGKILKRTIPMFESDYKEFWKCYNSKEKFNSNYTIPSIEGTILCDSITLLKEIKIYDNITKQIYKSTMFNRL